MIGILHVLLLPICVPVANMYNQNHSETASLCSFSLCIQSSLSKKEEEKKERKRLMQASQSISIYHFKVCESFKMAESKYSRRDESFNDACNKLFCLLSLMALCFLTY